MKWWRMKKKIRGKKLKQKWDHIIHFLHERKKVWKVLTCYLIEWKSENKEDIFMLIKFLSHIYNKRWVNEYVYHFIFPFLSLFFPMGEESVFSSSSSTTIILLSSLFSFTTKQAT